MVIPCLNLKLNTKGIPKYVDKIIKSKKEKTAVDETINKRKTFSTKTLGLGTKRRRSLGIIQSRLVKC